MLFSRYKADFLRVYSENPANYVSILMYELERKTPIEVEGMKVEIENMEQVEETRAAIKKRYINQYST
jgi:hypothetical protein